MESRLVELEIRYTHLEAQVKELSDLVYRQDQQIAALRAQVAALEGATEPRATEADKPPHY